MAHWNRYHFLTTWRIEGDIHEVAGVLRDATDLPRWWPSVYLRVTELEPGDESLVGQRVELHTRGWLPYTLTWWFRVAEVDYPHSSRIVAEGDFVGQGVWRLRQDGSVVEVTFDWDVAARKPLLRWLSPLMRPAFAANHRWAMARGEESLRRELERVRAGKGGAAPRRPA